MGLGKSRCDVPNGITQGQDYLRNVSNNQRNQVVLGEVIFEKFKIESLKIHGLIKDAKKELRLLEVEGIVVHKQLESIITTKMGCTSLA
jgi:Tfp pilus assembly protein PilP